MTTTSSISSTLAQITSGSSTTTSSGTGTSKTSDGTSFTYELLTQTVTNPVKASVFYAPHLGYLDQDKTALAVQGTITREASTNYFSFTYRTGSEIKLATNMNKGVRVQLLDAAGGIILADNGGNNTTLKQAFEDFTNGTLDLKNGNYMLKVTYDASADKTKTLNYELTMTSGEQYASKYKTYAAAATIYNTLLEGGDIGNVYSQGAAAASLLVAQMNGEDINVIDYLA